MSIDVGQRILVEAGYKRFVDFGERLMREGARRAAGSLTVLKQAANQIEDLMRNDPASVAAANEKVAELATEAVVRAYVQSVREERNPQYNLRRNRMPEGALYRALVEFTARGDAYGVHYINKEGLDAAARQWARLAYGAGGVGHPYHGSYPLTLGGRTVGPPLVDASGARPPFDIPAGIWRDASGAAVVGGSRGDGAAFFPSRLSGFRSVDFYPTRGIEARDFFEAGLEAIAAELPRAYTEVVRAWVDRGFRAAGATG